MSQSQTNPPEGKYLSNTVNGVELSTHYLDYGSGTPVVFLHGSGPGASAYSNFKQNIDAVVQSGYRAILIDMIGFGYSSKPVDCDYTTQLFASHVQATLDALDIAQCHLLGNSLGGAIAIRLALDNPEAVQSLIMMAPGGIEERETYFAMPGIAKMVSAFVDGGLDRDGLRTVLETLVHDPKHVTQALIDERFGVLQSQPPSVLSRMIIPNMSTELAQLRCPIYGFWGEQDAMTPVTGAKHFTSQCQQAQFTILSQCGHWVMVEHAELFNQYLRGILQGNYQYST